MIRHQDTRQCLLIRSFLFLPRGLSFVGGGIKDETPEEALFRELKEEIGINRDNVVSCKAFEQPLMMPPRIFHVPAEIFFFEIETNLAPGSLALNWEVLSATWVMFDEIEKLLTEYYCQVFHFFYDTGKTP